jgi:hypothetical protein
MRWAGKGSGRCRGRARPACTWPRPRVSGLTVAACHSSLRVQVLTGTPGASSYCTLEGVTSLHVAAGAQPPATARRRHCPHFAGCPAHCPTPPPYCCHRRQALRPAGAAAHRASAGGSSPAGQGRTACIQQDGAQGGCSGCSWHCCPGCTPACSSHPSSSVLPKVQYSLFPFALVASVPAAPTTAPAPPRCRCRSTRKTFTARRR